MRTIKRVARRLGLALALATTLLAPVGPGGRAEAIVGGVEAAPLNHPHFVHLDQIGCGSTYIADGTLLTAAHCVDDNVPQAFKVRGKPVASITLHPLWDGQHKHGHDLAVLRVPGLFLSTTALQVGAPWEPSFYSPDHPATIVGKGRTSAGGPLSAQLRAVDTVLRSDGYMDDVYNPWYWTDHWNEPFHIGAGSSTRTACHGDSGGPLFVDRDPADATQSWVQVGVASFGKDGCDDPAGFTELRKAQLAWLAQEVPTIKYTWGICHTSTGEVGRSAARYVPWYLPGAQREGAFYWEFRCDNVPKPDPPSPGGPPQPTGPVLGPDDPDPAPEEPTDEPPLPPLCRNRPWLCEDT